MGGEISLTQLFYGDFSSEVALARTTGSKRHGWYGGFSIPRLFGGSSRNDKLYLL